MKECYVCKIPEEKASLYEGISSAGFCYICRKCYFKHKIPLVEKKEVDLGEINHRPTVRERLSSMAGLNKKDKNVEKSGMIEQDKFPEEELRELVESNFKKKVEETIDVSQVVDNFHWIIMRKRRSLRLTRAEFAEKIFEPLVVVEILESGKLPKDYFLLLRKIENFLGTTLLKSSERFHPDLLANESKISSGLKIRDLKNLKEDKRKDDLKDFDKIVQSHMEGKPVSKSQMSEEEMEKIIFGRK
jgi:ribosome-binding protein aMBF1 (putative translation factor)